MGFIDLFKKYSTNAPFESRAGVPRKIGKPQPNIEHLSDYTPAKDKFISPQQRQAPPPGVGLQ